MANAEVSMRVGPAAEEATTDSPFVERATAEFKAIQGIQDHGQFVGAVVSAVVTLIRARAAFVFTPNARGVPQCIANRMSEGVRPQLVYSSEIRSIVDEVLKTRETVRRDLNDDAASARYCFLCAPVPAENGSILALGALVGPERTESLRECDLLLGFVAQWFERRQQVAEVAALEAGYERSKLLLEIFHEAGQTEDYSQAMNLLADEIQRFVGCHQVAIGFGNQRRFEVAAISGAGKHDARGHTATLLARVMKEAVGVKSIVSWPVDPNLPDSVLTAANQEELLKSLDCDATLTLPLIAGEKDGPIGAWFCSWKKGEGKNKVSGLARKWELIDALTPHIGVVAGLIHRSKPRGILAKVSRGIRKASRLKKAAWIVMPLLLIGSLFYPIEYRIAADGRIQASELRQIAAPFDGVLLHSTVEPGQILEEGQVLAVLDGKELSWRLAESKATRNSKLKMRDEAMARDDVMSGQLAQIDADTLALDIELYQWRIQNLEVRAPIDGLLLSGNLDQSAGVPVSKGQKLFEIAPIDELRLEVAVPDGETPYVKPGMDVELRLESQPNRVFESEIAAVYPISEIQDNENVFVCYATLPNDDGTLRPGMRGRVKVVSEQTTLGWRLFHKPLEFLRLHFWW